MIEATWEQIGERLVELTSASYQQFAELVGYDEAQDLTQMFKFLATGAGAFDGAGDAVEMIEGNCRLQVILRTYDIAYEYQLSTKDAAQVLKQQMQAARTEAALS
jgi:hypothetical protein